MLIPSLQIEREYVKSNLVRRSMTTSKSKMKPNYKYRVSSVVEVESRKTYIKNLRAVILYIEEEVTDEDFHQMALGLKPFPNVDTFKINGVAEI